MSEVTGSARVAETLVWAAATRDDAAVALALRDGSDFDGLYGLGHARIVDVLFCWLGEYVRQLERANRDRVIAFVQPHYGICYTSELAFLLGRRVKEPNTRGAQSLEELLTRLGLPPSRGPP